jgi:hypothetical protein
VYPPGGATRRRSTTSHVARGVTTTVAVARLQRVARLFLMRHALQRIPVYTPMMTNSSLDEASTTSHDGINECDSICNAADAPSSTTPVMGSRMVHRIRAELDREERLSSLRATIAKRTLIAALRAWVRYRRTTPRCYRASLSDSDEDTRRLQFCAVQRRVESEGTMEKALCTLQAVLRARHSGRSVESLRDAHQRACAATRIQRAWRRSSFHAAYIHRLHDYQARTILFRQESLERRDLLRRHVVFLVRCHQLLYNAPCMWEAGLCIRRLPLYHPDGLFLCGNTLSHLPASMQVLPATPAAQTKRIVADGVQKSLTTAAAFAGPQSGEFSSHRAAAESESCRRRGVDDSFHDGRESGKCVQYASDAKWSLSEELDVDAELRNCQYRLFFSPEDRLLLQLQEDEDEEAMTSLCTPARETDSAERQQPPALANTSLGQEAGSCSGLSHTHSLTFPAQVDDSESYAKAFASALTSLRQQPTVDPALQHVFQRLEEVRSDPVRLMRVLRAHGHLPSELVAPFACYGLRYQSVARGEEDQSILSSTAAMQMCQPVTAGIASNLAAELRHCLAGAVPRKAGSEFSSLPTPLEEYKWRREVPLRHNRSGRRAVDAGALGEESGALLLRRSTTAVLQRSGFANPSTEALFHPPGDETSAVQRGETGSTADVSAAGDHLNATPRPTNDGGGNRSCSPAAWDHRLAAGEAEVGAVWRQFLLSIPAFSSSSSPSAAPADHVKGGSSQRNGNAESPPSAAQQGRRFVGLCSHLLPSVASTPLLLRDFQQPSVSGFLATGEDKKPGRTTWASAAGTTSVEEAASSKPRFAPPFGAATSTVLRAEDWWDAVERLFVQERFRRRAMEQNEGVQRRSIGILHCLASSTVGAASAVQTLGDCQVGRSA